VDERATGNVQIETYTVLYDRDGVPERGIALCRTASGARAVANVAGADDLLELTVSEGGGRAATLREDGELSLV
jgi:acetyl-CoA C-acetyltransferase